MTPDQTLADLLEGAEERLSNAMWGEMEWKKIYAVFSQELIKAFEAGRPTELQIGQLRQFLNERDWSKQITNDEIKIWL